MIAAIELYRKQGEELITDFILDLDDSRLDNLVLELSKYYAYNNGLLCCPSIINTDIQHGLYSKDFSACANLLEKILEIWSDDKHLKEKIVRCDFIHLTLPLEYHDHLVKFKNESDDIHLSLIYLNELFSAILKRENFSESTPVTDEELESMSDCVKRTLKQIENGNSKIKSLIKDGRKFFN